MPIDYALRAARLLQSSLLGYEYQKPTPAPKAEKPKRQRLWKPSAEEIFIKCNVVVSQTFPDGDPGDLLYPWMEKRNLKWLDVDRAVRKCTGMRRGGFYTWLAGMWDDYAADQIHDAKSHPDRVEKHTAFYSIDESGAVQPKSNPWKANG